MPLPPTIQGHLTNTAGVGTKTSQTGYDQGISLRTISLTAVHSLHKMQAIETLHPWTHLSQSWQEKRALGTFALDWGMHILKKKPLYVALKYRDPPRILRI